MTIASDDFKDGMELPIAHVYPRCGGQNISPELHWSGAPSGTRSLALTMVDEDVKPSGWSHWVVNGLSQSVKALAHGLRTLPSGATGVLSNFGDPVYAGPCPPDGTGTHHYRFTIWALPTASITIAPDAKAKDLEEMLTRTTIAKASITGWVKR